MSKKDETADKAAKNPGAATPAIDNANATSADPKSPETATSATAGGGNDASPDNLQGKQVRVIREGTLGPKLLVKGDVTNDPDYVAILEQKGQKKVELVK